MCQKSDFNLHFQIKIVCRCEHHILTVSFSFGCTQSYISEPFYCGLIVCTHKVFTKKEKENAHAHSPYGEHIQTVLRTNVHKFSAFALNKKFRCMVCARMCVCARLLATVQNFCLEIDGASLVFIHFVILARCAIFFFFFLVVVAVFFLRFSHWSFVRVSRCFFARLFLFFYFSSLVSNFTFDHCSFFNIFFAHFYFFSVWFFLCCLLLGCDDFIRTCIHLLCLYNSNVRMNLTIEYGLA